jgi:1,4-dihydroxy-2-naphthoate octaprenyltransferase
MTTSRVLEGFWRLADPKISITSIASMSIGAAVASAMTNISWTWLITFGVAMFCMEVAKNAWGDVFDYNSGTDLAVKPEDRTNFSGGKRVLVDQILTRQQTWLIALGFALVELCIGAVIVLFKEPSVFWLGCLGLLLGWSYHGPPLRFAYRGLGELDVLLCYGPIIALCTHIILTGQGSMSVVWLAVPLGLFIGAFLWVNEFPDFDADRSAGKWNLVAMLGKHNAAYGLLVIYALGYVTLFIACWLAYAPMSVLGALVSLPTALLASYWVIKDPVTFYRNQPVQPFALLTFVLYSAGASVGFVVGA